MSSQPPKRAATPPKAADGSAADRPAPSSSSVAADKSLPLAPLLSSHPSSHQPPPTPSLGGTTAISSPVAAAPQPPTLEDGSRLLRGGSFALAYDHKPKATSDQRRRALMLSTISAANVRRVLAEGRMLVPAAESGVVGGEVNAATDSGKASSSTAATDSAAVGVKRPSSALASPLGADVSAATAPSQPSARRGARAEAPLHASAAGGGGGGCDPSPSPSSHHAAVGSAVGATFSKVATALSSAAIAGPMDNYRVLQAQLRGGGAEGSSSAVAAAAPAASSASAHDAAKSGDGGGSESDDNAEGTGNDEDDATVAPAATTSVAANNNAAALRRPSQKQLLALRRAPTMALRGPHLLPPRDHSAEYAQEVAALEVADALLASVSSAPSASHQHHSSAPAATSSSLSSSAPPQAVAAAAQGAAVTNESAIAEGAEGCRARSRSRNPTKGAGAGGSITLSSSAPSSPHVAKDGSSAAEQGVGAAAAAVRVSGRPSLIMIDESSAATTIGMGSPSTSAGAGSASSPSVLTPHHNGLGAAIGLAAPLSYPHPHPQRLYTIVLDLDETVVYARDGPLYARSHLRELLLCMHAVAEVVVWTAGEREYAKAVLEEINTDHVIRHLIYRHRRWFDEADYTKDLTLLGRDMRFVLIIENTPDCVRANPMNGIIVEDFEPSTTAATATAAAAAADTTAGLSDPEEAAASPAESVEESPSRRRSVSGGREQKNASSLPTEAVSASASASTASATVAVDHTFRKLITLVTDLGNSGNTPVPEFLSSYPLLRRQRVVGSNGETIPIFYLSSRRARRVPVPASVASAAVTAATAVGGGSVEAVGAKASADGSGPAAGSSAVAVAADDGFKVAKGGAGKVIKANRDKKAPPA